jgi:hypothetical protein
VSHVRRCGWTYIAFCQRGQRVFVGYSVYTFNDHNLIQGGNVANSGRLHAANRSAVGEFRDHGACVHYRCIMVLVYITGVTRSHGERPSSDLHPFACPTRQLFQRQSPAHLGRSASDMHSATGRHLSKDG